MIEFEETNIVKDVVKVTPWKNKAEFVKVYELIFGENANENTKKIAYEILIIWKLRRLESLPASVSSTLTILEVQLKDETKIPVEELKTLYSTACTRFLNYMTSIMISKQFKTMYASVTELGLETFLVDLRHMFSHGQVTPSLDILQRSATYCLNWLKVYYWNHQLIDLTDATVEDIRPKSIEKYYKELSKNFNIYDNITEALHRGYKNVEHIDRNFHTEKLETIKRYSKQIKETSLSLMLVECVRQFSKLMLNDEKRRTTNRETICSVITKGYFIEAPEMVYKKTGDCSKNEGSSISLTKIHQHFFRTMAKHGFNKLLFDAFVKVFENENETTIRRNGAIFWANKLVQGFVILKGIKNLNKQNTELGKRPLNINTVNQLERSKPMDKLCEEIGVNVDDSLIFADTIKQPLCLKFSTDDLLHLISNVNSLSLELIENCISLAEPQLSELDLLQLNVLMSLYLGKTKTFTRILNQGINREKVFTLNRDFLKNDEIEDKEIYELEDIGVVPKKIQKYGVWTECSDKVNWSSCPIGLLPWNPY